MMAGPVGLWAVRRPGSTYLDMEAMPWEPTKFPGILWKILYREDGGTAFTALMRMAPGARLPKHMHTEVEQSYVLQGSLVDDEGACTGGNFVWRCPGSVHSAWSPDGAPILAIFQRPNQFLE